MGDLERDLRIVSLFVDDLKPYLLSNRLYWSLSEAGPLSHPFPMGTLGGLFLRLRRLESSKGHLSPEHHQQLVELCATMEQQLAHWVVQSESKAMREVKARLQTWSAYLGDLADDPRRYGPEYPVQVEGRTIVELLLGFLGHAANEQGVHAGVNSLDQHLRALTAEGAFVWDMSLAPAFPQDPFWYLYRSPRL